MFNKIYQRYALFALMLAYTLSFMDRIMLGLYMQPLKEEFQLSDTQLGFLSGIAFAFFFAVLGVPIARWADRGNRVTISSLTIALWSVTVMLTAAVTNFFQLILVRVGAAVGEAGVVPPAYSLIADYFCVEERARAVTVYMMAIPLGLLISYLFAGWAGEVFGWRTAFFLVGIPGIFVAVLIKLTVREPRCVRGLPPEAEQTLEPFWVVVNSLIQRPSYRYILISLTLTNFVSMGVGQWNATLFLRSHGMSLGELGNYLGLIAGMGGAIGLYCGGFLVSRFLAEDARKQVRFGAVIAIISMCLSIGVFLAPIKSMALGLLVPLSIIGWLAAGPMTAVLLQLVEDRRRATAMAIMGFVVNLIGMGLGPQVVGIMSDVLNPYWGVDALRVAMTLAVLTNLAAAYYCWRAGNFIEQDLVLVQSGECLFSSVPSEQVPRAPAQLG